MLLFNVKNKVVADYNGIAQQAEDLGLEAWRKHVCLPIYAPIEAEYRATEGYFEGANLGLGCGFPVKYADLKTGDSVLDLGCAAGIDSFIAAAKVGQTGRVQGLDLSPLLVEKARQNAQLQGLENVHFTVGDMENMSFEAAQFDAIISNGVFSLMTDKLRVFKKMYRVLKPKGGFCISDLLRNTNFPQTMMPDILELTGCFNGISLIQDYIFLMEKAGFKNVKIVATREVEIPDLLLDTHFSEAEKMVFEAEKMRLYAVTFKGEK